MEHYDVIIVGGGPAGAACAWRLVQQGRSCLVLDREPFPRSKLCAGWITPEVVADLALEGEYPHGLLTFEQIHVQLWKMGFKLNGTQHSIRRYEFDNWLLQRSGAPVNTHTVKHIEREGKDYVIDGSYRCQYLVGAAGTRCPVYRHLFQQANPRARELQAVTLEEEFPYDWHDPACRLWFFQHGLPGYAWYVPKANGHLNVGIGAMATRLKAQGKDIKGHWARFQERLQRDGLVRDHNFAASGYSYYLRAGVQTLQIDNAFIVGDSAGLATRDLCEGIGPAVRTGMLAANAITAATPYTLAEVGSYSLGSTLLYRFMEYMLINRGSHNPALATVSS